jgi:hypothetical protein
MAMDGGTTGSTMGGAQWLEPDSDLLVLPLNLRSHLARFGLGGDDYVVIDGIPDGAELTVGECKPDGSYSLRESDLDRCAFVPLYGNGETYKLRACVLTPDPSDHGLAKTKGKTEIMVEVPLTPIPVLEHFDDAPAPAQSAAAADSVILLPADPALKASEPPPAPTPAAAPAAKEPPAPSAATVSQTPPAPAVAPAPAPPSEPAKPAVTAADIEQYLTGLRSEWHANLARQVAAAERRLKATHLAQLSKIQTALVQEEAQRAATLEGKWKAELMRRAGETEAELKARAKEHIAGVAARLRGSGDTAEAEDWPTQLEQALADARAAWEREEAERRATLEAEMSAAYGQRIAQLEAQQAALYEMRLASAEAAWRKTESERLAAAEAAWSVGEAERLAAAEARWRAEHDKRFESVLANFDTMVKGQWGAAGAAHLPPVEPLAPSVSAPQAPAADAQEGDAGPSDDLRWRETAAA